MAEMARRHWRHVDPLKGLQLVAAAVLYYQLVAAAADLYQPVAAASLCEAPQLC